MEIQKAEPWWKHGFVWLVISGPVIVILASFVTLYFAIKTPDPAIENYYVKGMQINRTLEAQEALAPAINARNHAQTGLKIKPKN